jgi:very-short-patch-repair endonuclease
MDVQATAGWLAAAELATTQHGRLTVAQLRNCGVGRGAIEKAVRSGRLHRVHEGVYALGHVAPSLAGDHMAAVLRCGPLAALGGWSAATHLGLQHRPVWPIEVISPSGRGRGVRGIAVSRAPLGDADRVVIEGVPVVSVARVLSDLSRRASELEIRALIREAQYQRIFDLGAALTANKRHPSRLLSAILADLTPTESPLEDLFRQRILRRFPQIPEPDVQTRFPGARVDFRWARARLTVEIDGSHHANPLTRQQDIARDNLLQLSGELVLRYAKPDLTRHARRTAGQIVRALNERGAHDIPWMY